MVDVCDVCDLKLHVPVVSEQDQICQNKTMIIAYKTRTKLVHHDSIEACQLKAQQQK